MTNCAIHFSQVHHFADDTNLINFSGSLKQLAKRMNLDLKLLCHWLNANKISLNASKTEYVIFKHALKPMNFDFRLFINGKRLFPSNCIKYLGVLLDSDLSWKSQINNTVLKLKRANGALAKLRHFVQMSWSKSILLFSTPICNTAIKFGVRITMVLIVL